MTTMILCFLANCLSSFSIDKLCDMELTTYRGNAQHESLFALLSENVRKWYLTAWEGLFKKQLA
jgi:hypothetical protein